MEMSDEPQKKRRRVMEPHVGGDDLSPDAGLNYNSKSALRVPTASASGDFSSTVEHEFVSFIVSQEESGAIADPTERFDILKFDCDQQDGWVQKYPFPLSNFPNRPIRTGNFYYDGIIPDLEFLGYRPLQVIAKGRSGTIILAQDVHKRKIDREIEPVAMKLNSGKSRRKTRNSWKTDMMSELTIHRQLAHPNIVTWLNNINYQGRVGTVLEFCEIGNLEQLVRQHEARFLTEGVANRYFKQLFSAVEYLHGRNIAHRDICPQNVLITHHNTAKLSDFGHAIEFNTADPPCTDECGTLGYQAPEIVLQSLYHPHLADIWSLGAVLYTVVIGHLPLGIIKSEITAIASKQLSFPARRVMPLSSPLKDLLKGLLAYLAESRFTLRRIRYCEWMVTEKKKVQIGNFYMNRQPQKSRVGSLETVAKHEFKC